jgi:hypothetical protein
MAHHFDERTWAEGRRHGYVEGYEEGRYQGFAALRSSLLAQLGTMGVDLQLQLLDLYTPLEVLQEVLRLVESVDAGCPISLAVEASSV